MEDCNNLEKLSELESKKILISNLANNLQTILFLAFEDTEISLYHRLSDRSFSLIVSNGFYDSVGMPRRTKYASVISYEELDSPAFDINSKTREIIDILNKMQGENEERMATKKD